MSLPPLSARTKALRIWQYVIPRYFVLVLLRYAIGVLEIAVLWRFDQLVIPGVPSHYQIGQRKSAMV